MLFSCFFFFSLKLRCGHPFPVCRLKKKTFSGRKTQIEIKIPLLRFHCISDQRTKQSVKVCHLIFVQFPVRFDENNGSHRSSFTHTHTHNFEPYFKLLHDLCICGAFHWIFHLPLIRVSLSNDSCSYHTTELTQKCSTILYNKMNIELKRYWNRHCCDSAVIIIIISLRSYNFTTEGLSVWTKVKKSSKTETIFQLKYCQIGKSIENVHFPIEK